MPESDARSVAPLLTRAVHPLRKNIDSRVGYAVMGSVWQGVFVRVHAGMTDCDQAGHHVNVVITPAAAFRLF